MITLRWAPFPQAAVANYRVYRSIIGFVAPTLTPGDWAGLDLQLKLNGGPLQTVTFGGVLGIVAEINAVLTGGRAYTSNDPAQFLLRSDIRDAPGSLEVVGGTALATLNQSARLITERSEDILIATVGALEDPNAAVTFTDHDGALQDFYAVTTLDSFANESMKTAYQQPVASTGDLCVLEGLVADLRGVRIPDAAVTATLIAFPYSPTTPSHITLEPVTALSGPDGRYSLVLLQGATVRLEIPTIGLTREILVPAQQFAFVSDLLADDNAQLSTDANLGVL